ncbi:MAG TPA: DUF975 family protein [Clostridiales bacterium]|nr:DUF975 family protein [Clostridiales bacterium]
MLNHTRAEMKAAAKSALEGKWGTAIGALLLSQVVPAVVLCIAICLMVFMAYLCIGYGAVGSGIIIWILVYIFEFAFIFLILGPLTITYRFFNLRLGRGLEVNATMPYQCFQGVQYRRVALSYFMYTLFIFLWSLIFVVPALLVILLPEPWSFVLYILCFPLLIPMYVKMLSYDMMFFVMLDHPETNWQSALNESKQMMHGHKTDLFVLYLSFIPWLLLVGVTAGLAGLYVYPYMYTTVANFYRSLKEENVAAAGEIPNEFIA